MSMQSVVGMGFWFWVKFVFWYVARLVPAALVMAAALIWGIQIDWTSTSEITGIALLTVVVGALTTCISATLEDLRHDKDISWQPKAVALRILEIKEVPSRRKTWLDEVREEKRSIEKRKLAKEAGTLSIVEEEVL